jgi:GNAT superfamily N-acetyltransferase
VTEPAASSQGTLSVRGYDDTDLPAVLRLMQDSLGWKPSDPNAEFFAWKHVSSPFGRSPAWVALDGDQIVGFRTFMRWEFRTPGGIVRAVRAVDTATAPSHQGRGIFKRLTLAALDELLAEGVGFVFNTPNDQSRPGYLKMGWHEVGQLPLVMRPAGIASLSRLARARTAAELWSVDTSSGLPAEDALRGDDRQLAALLAAVPAPSGLTTHRTPDYLRWRYGFAPLRYRVALVSSRLDDGMVVYRLRRRGGALEAAVAEILMPPGRTAGAVVRRVVRASHADYALAVGRYARGRGLLPAPVRGPVLTFRALVQTTQPPLPDWALSLGDVELF